MTGRAFAIAAAVVVLGALGVWLFLPRENAVVDPTVEISDDDGLGTRAITLYFGNAQGDGLVPESRTIQAQRYRDQEVEAVLAELVRGPESSDGIRTMPDGTRLRQAFYDEEQRLLYLDFNRALVAQPMAGSTMEVMTLTAILRTIAVDFPEVRAVQFLVEGLEVETLGGHLDLTRPLRPGDWL